MNSKKESLIVILLRMIAYISVIITIFIVLNLVFESASFFKEYSPLDFLTGTTWAPDSGVFGVLPLFLGTLKVVVLSSLVAIPIGLLCAIYLSEYASKRTRNIIKPILELLAGIPTIIYGFFAYNFINPLILHGDGAYSTLGASIALGVMLIPMVASLSEDSLRAVPSNLKEASIGLGATRFETTSQVLIPAALSGIISSFVLAISRAFGETMIVSLAAGQVASMSLNPLNQSMTMTGAIIQSAGTDASVTSPEYTVLFALGLVLFGFTMILNLVSKAIINRHHVDYNSDVIKKPKKDRKFKLIKNYSYKYRNTLNNIFKAIGLLAIIFSVSFLFLLIGYIFIDGIGVINLHFIFGPLQLANSAINTMDVGIFNAILGSLFSVITAMVLAVPIGIGAGIYLEEYANKKSRSYNLLSVVIANLNGVPSVIYGLLGASLFLFFDLRGTIIAAAVALAMLTLPVIIVTTQEALKTVPNTLKEGAYGLGMSKWQVINAVTIPYAKSNIITGIILSISRAIGETAPLIMVGVSVSVSYNPQGLTDKMSALPVIINEFTSSATANGIKLAAGTSLVLLVILLVLNMTAVMIRLKAQKNK